jgi:acyl transferase domain-containing protein/acyl carrier protein
MTEYATARLWMSWGVRPAAMIGHSLGEYVAACLSGVFSLRTALKLVVMRGKLFEGLPDGEMLSVALPENELLSLLNQKLSIAAVNGPAQCVVSGAVADVDEFARLLDAKGVERRALKISVGAHSTLVEPILGVFRQSLEGVGLQPPAIPFISNVTGNWIRTEEATTADYWVRQLRQTVRFGEGIEELLKEPQRVLLEVGPGRTLSTLAKAQQRPADTQVFLASLRHPYDRVSDLAFLLTTLGELWLSGVEVDWRGFYHHEPRNRLRLPTYPFERQRFWIEAGTGASLGGGARKPAALTKKRDIKDWFYLPTWEETVPPQTYEPERLIAEYPRVLVFVDEGGLGAQFHELLTGVGCEVVRVRAGDSFAKTDGGAYTLSPGEPAHYDNLLVDLLASGEGLSAILHLWSVTPSQDAAGAQDLSAHMARGFYSLVYLAQALSRQSFFHPLKLLVVSTGVQEVIGTEVLCAEKAALLGPCKSIPQEYLNVSCQAIDVGEPSGKAWERALAAALASELLATANDHVVAYRGRRRWVQTFSPVTLPGAKEHETVFREGGVYLITGGLGGVGLTLAEYLSRTVRARLILVGRTALPPREEWPLLLDGGDEEGERVRRVVEMERLGAEVLALAADVAEPAEMHEVVRRGFERFGALNGVIHAAGVVGTKAVKAIPELHAEECEAQFRPKVSGLYSLAESLAGIELDFCLLTSSLAAILGGLGYATYAGASAFMDTFARSHSRTRAVPWLSIDSDLWQIGAANASTQTWSQLPMTSEEGSEAIERALRKRWWPQIVISTGDLQARIDQWVNLEPMGDASAREEKGKGAGSHSRPNLRNAYVPPSSDLERVIAGILQGRLGIEQVGLHDNFFDLGGQSLLATQVVSALRDAFQIEISLRSLFEMPTVAGMSQTIEAIGEREGVDLHRAAQVILQLNELSEDEVKSMLAARQN